MGITVSIVAALVEPGYRYDKWTVYAVSYEHTYTPFTEKRLLGLKESYVWQTTEEVTITKIWTHEIYRPPNPRAMAKVRHIQWNPTDVIR